MTGRGFTLVEMLVALAIFAVLGVISATLMERTIANEEILGVRSERLAEVQRAMRFLKRDLMQITNRPIRDLLGDPLQPVLIGDDGLIEFTRLGWRNPVQARRSELQRVAYRMHEGTLHRAYWNVLDRAQGSEPVVQPLLAEVQQIEFFALDANGYEHSFWPPQEEAPANPANQLVAILMRIDCHPFGFVERIWPVVLAP